MVEAFLAKKYSRSRGKYKGKVHLIYFSCEEIGHIAARCPNKKHKNEKKGHKCNDQNNFKGHKSFKDKGKKTCFMAKNSKDLDSSEDEIVYIAIKDEYDNDDEEDEMALFTSYD